MCVIEKMETNLCCSRLLLHLRTQMLVPCICLVVVNHADEEDAEHAEECKGAQTKQTKERGKERKERHNS